MQDEPLARSFRRIRWGGAIPDEDVRVDVEPARPVATRLAGTHLS